MVIGSTATHLPSCCVVCKEDSWADPIRRKQLQTTGYSHYGTRRQQWDSVSKGTVGQVKVFAQHVSASPYLVDDCVLVSSLASFEMVRHPETCHSASMSGSRHQRLDTVSCAVVWNSLPIDL